MRDVFRISAYRAEYQREAVIVPWADVRCDGGLLAVALVAALAMSAGASFAAGRASSR